MTPTNDLRCSLCDSEFIEEFQEEEEEQQQQQQEQQQQQQQNNPFQRGFGFVRMSSTNSTNSTQSSFSINDFFGPNMLFQDIISMINGARTNNQQETGQQQQQQFFRSGSFGFTGQFNNLFNGGFFGTNNLDDIISQLIDNNKYGSPPTDKDALSKLKRFSADQEFVDKKETCPICFDDYQLEDKVIKLTCNHQFHENCCTTWLKEHSTCPTCRTRLPSVDKEFDVRIREKEKNEKLEREKKIEQMKIEREKKQKEKVQEKFDEKNDEIEENNQTLNQIQIESQIQNQNQNQNENQNNNNSNNIIINNINNNNNNNNNSRNNNNNSYNNNNNNTNQNNPLNGFEDIEGEQEINFLEDVLNDNFSIDNFLNPIINQTSTSNNSQSRNNSNSNSNSESEKDSIPDYYI
ncbi:e3 ubiquitin-protein ligase ring1-like [Anaeramoeba flamelloides]|uniref:E3 ubiquitin-protein ligase ring1-like n=1 Tax=Anaeramoeba flamelloides TaxID=1746091 RepID=A0ABQ8Y4T7_9EUKA|nr:e3 ubiquitin-protein ligase ring1-like [Anaeramoeba flamelloides]